MLQHKSTIIVPQLKIGMTKSMDSSLVIEKDSPPPIYNFPYLKQNLFDQTSGIDLEHRHMFLSTEVIK